MDGYWILDSPAIHNLSSLGSFWGRLGDLLSFSGQWHGTSYSQGWIPVVAPGHCCSPWALPWCAAAARRSSSTSNAGRKHGAVKDNRCGRGDPWLPRIRSWGALAERQAEKQTNRCCSMSYIFHNKNNLQKRCWPKWLPWSAGKNLTCRRNWSFANCLAFAGSVACALPAIHPRDVYKEKNMNYCGIFIKIRRFFRITFYARSSKAKQWLARNT